MQKVMFGTNTFALSAGVKPGVLLLEQYDIFRGGSGDGTYRFTAKFDEKTGNFQITSKKNVPSKE